LFQGVLGSQHQEGLGQLETFFAQGDLPFLHGLEQGRLNLAGRAVDLVGQQQVGEDGALLGGEVQLLGIENQGAHHIAGQEVRRELDAAETQVRGLGEGLDRSRFRQSRQAFQQHMAPAQQRHQQTVQEEGLSHDDLAAFGEQGIKGGHLGGGGHGASWVMSK